MAQRNYKRRRILIDRRQLRLLGVTVLYFMVTAVVFAAMMFGPLVPEISGDTASTAAQGAAASEFLALHARFWPALFATFVILSVHSIFASHRIVGPLARLRAGPSPAKAVTHGSSAA